MCILDKMAWWFRDRSMKLHTAPLIPGCFKYRVFRCKQFVCFVRNLEILYQTYTETHISREIRRQTVCRSISKTSADYPMDYGPPRLSTSSSSSAEGLRSSPINFQRTLWQDQPIVRESGILDTIAPEECKYQEVKWYKFNFGIKMVCIVRVIGSARVTLHTRMNL